MYERDSLDNIEGFDARVITCLQVGLCHWVSAKQPAEMVDVGHMKSSCGRRNARFTGRQCCLGACQTSD